MELGVEEERTRKSDPSDAVWPGCPHRFLVQIENDLPIEVKEKRTGE
jgi:hypothetical protein